MARGRRAVRESAHETAVAVIKPVHRPTSLASVLGCMYDGVRSSNTLLEVSVSLLPLHRKFLPE